jgi:hypothetical protein
MRAVGRPRRVATLRHLQTPFQTWFYGRTDDYVVILVGGRVLALARAPDRDQ